MKSPTAKQEGRHPLNWASSSFAAHANRSTHKPARETPRGFQLVYRNGRGDGGTDSAMRTSVRRPTATVPSRCRGACDASPAVAECHEFVTLSDSRRIVAAVANHAIWPMPWPSTFTLQWRNRIDQRQHFLRVVPIRAGQAQRERHTTPVAHQMTLAPALGSIGGFGPLWSPPYTARMEQLSTTARDQSIWLKRASQSSSAK
jgi:hypothetical protein